MTLELLRKEMKSLVDPARAKISQSFFKTRKGEYGEGDIFLGLTVPQSRKLAVKYKDLPLGDAETLLHSKIHEERLIALLLLVHNYKTCLDKRQEIFDFYLANARQVNNWDLVDLSSPQIIGVHLIDKDKRALYELVCSENLWKKRIAIVSTYYFIKNNRFEDTLKIAKILLHDKHDLIHKAVGWMLREVGNRNLESEETFLKKHYKNMPRTMLRYAIERFPEDLRQGYLRGRM